MAGEGQNFGINNFNRLKFSPKMLWIAVVLILGIVLMSLGNFVKTEVSHTPETDAGKTEMADNFRSGEETANIELNMEKRMEKVLSQIEGAGEVTVVLLLENGPEYRYVTNETTDRKTIEEEDQNGGKRLTTQANKKDELVLVRSERGVEEPVIVKKHNPTVRGVLVVATGAKDPVVRAGLANAVQTLLDVGAHQVRIYPRKGGE